MKDGVPIWQLAKAQVLELSFWDLFNQDPIANQRNHSPLIVVECVDYMYICLILSFTYEISALEYVALIHSISHFNFLLLMNLDAFHFLCIITCFIWTSRLKQEPVEVVWPYSLQESLWASWMRCSLIEETILTNQGFSYSEYLIKAVIFGRAWELTLSYIEKLLKVVVSALVKDLIA